MDTSLTRYLISTLTGSSSQKCKVTSG